MHESQSSGVVTNVSIDLQPHTDPQFSHGYPFQPGHITTIEPGFYKEGEWGIRTESVYLCKNVEVSHGLHPQIGCLTAWQTMYDFGGKVWLGWERVTQVRAFPSLQAIAHTLGAGPYPDLALQLVSHVESGDPVAERSQHLSPRQSYASDGWGRR